MSSLLRPVRLPAHVLWVLSLPALALVLAGALTVRLSANTPFFQGWDERWRTVQEASRTPWLTSANHVLDFVGNDGMILYAVLLLVVLLFRHPRLAWFTAAANAAVLLVTQGLKALVDRPRPLHPLVAVDHGSYPSGHTSGTVAAVLATALVMGRVWMWLSGAILSVAMIYSRTYLGAHWLSDTIAGALLGLGLVLALWILMQRWCLAAVAPPVVPPPAVARTDGPDQP